MKRAAVVNQPLNPQRTAPTDSQTRPPGTALLVVVALAAVLAMGWLCPHEFTNWDDDLNVASNPSFNPPTLQGVLFYWRAPFAGLYVPVTYSAWGLLASVAYGEQLGLNPWVFHGFNVLLHTANALLVLHILWRLVRGPSRLLASIAGAVLFAVHPVQVEPVGWVTGLKDVLSGFFTLTAILAYVSAAADDMSSVGEPERVRGDARFSWALYSLATLSFVLALLSKPSAAVAPFIVALLGVALLRQRAGRIAITLLPWIAVGIACYVLTRSAQPERSANVGASSAIPLWSRPQIVVDALTFYLGKIVFPLHLTVDYGRTPAVALQSRFRLLIWLPPMLLTLALVAFCIRRWPSRAGVVAGAGVAFVAVAPVLGMLPFDFQDISTVADRYLYLPMFGVSLTLASALAGVRAKRWLPVACVVLAALAVRSIVQTRYWSDSLTLFRHAVAENPDSWVGHNNLATPLQAAGLSDEALLHARRAVELKPTDVSSNNTLGGMLAAKGQLADAEVVYRHTLALAPNDKIALGSLAGLASAQGRPEEAIALARRAIAVDPRYATAHWVLGVTLDDRGQHDEAVRELAEAFELNGDVRTEFALARALIRLGRASEARHHLQHVLSVSPGLVDAEAVQHELEKVEAPRRP